MAKSGVLTVKIVGDDQGFKKTVGGAVKTAGKLAAGVAGAAVAAGGALAALTKKTADYGDAAAKNARATGLSTEAYQELKFAVGQAGIEGAAFDKTMVAFNKRIGEAAQGEQTMVDAFEAAGVAIRDQNGEIKSSDALFSEAITGVQKLGSEQEKAAVLADLFGARNGPLLASAVEGGAEGIEELRARAQELGVVMSDDTAMAAERFNDRLDDLKQGLGGIGRQIGTVLMPWLADRVLPAIRDNLIPAIGTLTGGFRALGNAFEQGDVTSSGFAGVMERIGVVAKKITEAFKGGGLAGALALVGSMMASVGPQILDALQGIVLKILDFLTNNLGSIVERMLAFREQLFTAALTLFTALVEALPGILPQVVEALTSIITSLVTTLMEAVPQLIDGALTLFTGLIDAAIDILPLVVDSVLEIITSVLEALLGALPKLLDAGLQLLTKLLEGIIKVLPEIIGFITGVLIPKILDFLLQALPQLLETGIALLTSLLAGLIEVLPTLVAWIVTDLIPQLVLAIIALVPKLAEVAVEALGAFLSAGQGVWDDHVMPWLRSLPAKVAIAAAGLWDGIKDAFRSAINWIIRKWNDLRITIGGGTFDLPGPFGSITIPSITLDTPNIPVLHSGGVFRAPAGRREGLALLEDGERVTPAGTATVHIENLQLPAYLGTEDDVGRAVAAAIGTAQRRAAILAGVA